MVLSPHTHRLQKTLLALHNQLDSEPSKKSRKYPMNVRSKVIQKFLHFPRIWHMYLQQESTCTLEDFARLDPSCGAFGGNNVVVELSFAMDKDECCAWSTAMTY